MSPSDKKCTEGPSGAIVLLHAAGPSLQDDTRVITYTLGRCSRLSDGITTKWRWGAGVGRPPLQKARVTRTPHRKTFSELVPDSLFALHEDRVPGEVVDHRPVGEQCRRGICDRAHGYTPHGLRIDTGKQIRQ